MLIKFEVQTELSVIRIFRFQLEKLEQITDAVFHYGNGWNRCMGYRRRFPARGFAGDEYRFV